MLHFIRQQTYRQSSRDRDRRTAYSDNQHYHSTPKQVERVTEKENVTLIESDDSQKAKNKRRRKSEVQQRLQKGMELVKTGNKRWYLLREISV